jgi:hypothetical protein
VQYTTDARPNGSISIVRSTQQFVTAVFGFLLFDVTHQNPKHGDDDDNN